MAERRISPNSNSFKAAFAFFQNHIPSLTINNIHNHSTNDVRTLYFHAQIEDGNVLLGRSSRREALRNIEIEVQSGRFVPTDMIRVAQQLPKDRYPIGASLLHKIAFDRLKLLELPEALPLLRFLISDVEGVIYVLHKYPYARNHETRRALVDSFGIDLLKEILNWLQYLLPQDNEIILCQGNCIGVLCSFSNEFGLWDKAFSYGIKGIEIFTQYQGNPKRSKYFGNILYEIGLALFHMGESDKSVNSFSDALQAFEEACDFHDNERIEWPKKARRAKQRAERDGSK